MIGVRKIAATEAPRILAISGGSCSGKTTLAAYLKDYIGASSCRLIRQDDYYHDISARGGSSLANFDIPEALDFELLQSHLLAFKHNQPVALPTYDFTTHKRCAPTEPLSPRALIIVDGILLLTQPKLRKVLDCSVYIACDAEIRLARRLERDMRERGRSRDDILRQFHEQVEPAHQTFVNPSKVHADLVIRQADYVSDITQVVRAITALINSTP